MPSAVAVSSAASTERGPVTPALRLSGPRGGHQPTVAFGCGGFDRTVDTGSVHALGDRELSAASFLPFTVKARS